MLARRHDEQPADGPAGAAWVAGDDGYARLCELRQAPGFREWWRLTLALGIDAPTFALLLAERPGPWPPDGGRHRPMPPLGRPTGGFRLQPIAHRPPDMPAEWVELVERRCDELFLPTAPCPPNGDGEAS